MANTSLAYSMTSDHYYSYKTRAFNIAEPFIDACFGMGIKKVTNQMFIGSVIISIMTQQFFQSF